MLSSRLSDSAQSRRERALSAVGTTIGHRWTLVGLLGSGGSATVYEAVHRNGRRVAIKVLHAELIAHDNVRRRFLAEGYAANLVRHEGAVSVLDDGDTSDGGAYLVMELLRGETLSSRLLRDGPLPLNHVLGWALAVLAILDAAHAHKVVHRDVKPSNVFITDRGEVKLLDFGIARISDDSVRDDLTTQQGVALGTPAFMAPEQAAGIPQQIGGTTDIWGVGATMFQLLTGRPVHDPSVSPAAISVAPPVRAFAPNLPPEVAKAIDRALSFRPSDRWPTAQSMINALELARDTARSPTPVAVDTLTEEGVVLPKARKSLSRVLLISALIGPVFAAAAYLLISGTHQPPPRKEVGNAAPPPARGEQAIVVTDVAPMEPPERPRPPALSPEGEAPRPKKRATPVPTSVSTRQQRAVLIEHAALDSILDRRK